MRVAHDGRIVSYGLEVQGHGTTRYRHYLRKLPAPETAVTNSKNDHNTIPNVSEQAEEPVSYPVVGQTAAEAYEKANALLSSIQTYMRLNKLHINMSKCCYIHFKPKVNVKYLQAELNTNYQLLIDGFPIRKTNQKSFWG